MKITILFVGHPIVEIKNNSQFHDFDVYSCTDEGLLATLSKVRPHVIFTFGTNDFKNLNATPLEVRRRWVHHDSVPETSKLAELAETVFIDITTTNRFPETPLISVITPTYKTGNILTYPYSSLLSQSYTNWEWVLYDDSPDDETWKLLQQLSEKDHRVRAYRGRPSGRIGEVKRRAAGLVDGQVIVELDHDDELTDHCLLDLVNAFKSCPQAGFAYTDFSEVLPDGSCNRYDDKWGLGFGSYRTENYRGREYLVAKAPPLNRTTIQHIVGVPNHVRAWQYYAYINAGRHGNLVHVCDDYELLIRTFLTTRMIHVNSFGYIQHIGTGHNTQTIRNAEIQRLSRLFYGRYAPEIEARFNELGVKDLEAVNLIYPEETKIANIMKGLKIVFKPNDPLEPERIIIDAKQD